MSDKPKLITDPKILGPGYWHVLHIKAKDANTAQKKKEFVELMSLVAETFPCGNCRKHINEYLNSHPFKDFYNLVNENGIDIGFSKYMWMFHNAVNTRIGKPYLDWDSFYDMYYNDGAVCVNCSRSSSRNPSVDSTPNHSPVPARMLPQLEKQKIVQGYFLKKEVNRK